MDWSSLKKSLVEKVSSMDAIYRKRLAFEISEIEKQGSESYWLRVSVSNLENLSNPNRLVIAWLLGVCSEDPILSRKTPVCNSIQASKLQKYKETYGVFPEDLVRDTDMPDIDIDCVPESRDRLKEYAIQKYGADCDDSYGSVCSVGTWQTYKLRSALIDAACALDLMSRYDAERYTTEMPDEVDELQESGKSACKGKVVKEDGSEDECGFVHDKSKCPKCGSEDSEFPTIGKLLKDVPQLLELYTKHPELVESSVQLVGRIRNQGMHAGALIITDRPLFGNIPLSRSGQKGFWQSMWTEGRSTQLSKFGYVKWDWLGLKTLKYIFKASQLVLENRGISFGENFEGLEYNDPEKRHAGFYYDANNEKHFIDMDDPSALAIANKQATDGVFQFDTDLAKCCRYDSEINIQGGSVPISELDPREHRISYVTDAGEIKHTSDFTVVCSGVKELLEVELQDGRILHLTRDHRVLTPSGYKRIGDMSIGEQIVEAEDYC